MTDTFVALDVEATGMDPGRHEIIEVAVVVSSPVETLERFSSLVRPRGAVSLDILSLTGIDRGELEAAPTMEQVAPRLRRLLAGRSIVGHSVAMDVAMLDAGGLVLPNPIYDTYQLATLLLPDLPAYGLVAVARSMGIAAPVGHRALPDADAAAAVFRGLLDRLHAHDATTLDQLAGLARTAGWSTAPLFEAATGRHATGPLFERPAEGEEPKRSGAHELAFLIPRERPEPLRPTGSRRRVDPDEIEAALAPGGPISRVVPGYEFRRQQREMAVAVADAHAEEGQLLVEAGTGTGKSVAYLLPSVLHAVERGETVVVSTNTLALQDQLYRKDIPDLRRALAERDGGGAGFEAAVLKGRTNYLCLRRWFAAARQPTFDPVEAQLRAKVLLWLGGTETGDRAELRLQQAEDGLWRHLSAEEHACVASRCVFNQRNQCFLYRARRGAEQAHLVVVNHALLLSDAVAGSRVLPEYEHLIVDEAHHLEDQATTQFGFAVDERAIVEFLDGVLRTEGSVQLGTLPTALGELTRASAGGEAAKRRASAAIERARVALDRSNGARAAARELFAALSGLMGRAETGRAETGRGGYERSLRLTRDVREDAVWLEVELSWDRLDRELRGLEEQLRWYQDALEAAAPGPEADELAAQQHEELIGEATAALRGGADLAAKLATVIGAPSDATVYWVERTVVGDQVALHAAPLRVGDVLREELFDRLASVVLTSATITTDGSFDYVAQRLGLERPAELVVQSPFDYLNSTLLYLADDIPEPSHPGYQRRLQETLIAACAATVGRALVLFTSHAALQATYRAIKGPLAEAGIVVLAQRADGSPRQLVERLRHSRNVVVLGTASFWEGIDVVGPALSLLVIAKLPFAVPSDPVFAARGELVEREGGHPFLDYAVPQAVLRFKQGFGRLIRSSHDRGVCAVLDRRVVSKRYGRSFVESLPDCSVAVGAAADLPEAAQGWLAGHGL